MLTIFVDSFDISILAASRMIFLTVRDPLTHKIADRIKKNEIFERRQCVTMLLLMFLFSAIFDASFEIYASDFLL